MHLAEQVKVQRSHAVVVGDTREEIHEYELTVPLASITRLLLRRGLFLCATLDNDDGGCTTTSNS